MGSSRPLDFGHWSAHKMEQMTKYRLHHGEAVAVGLALDVTYSYRQGWLTQAEWKRVLRTLTGVGFAITAPELRDRGLFDGLREFREHLGGELTITLLSEIGIGVEVHEMDETLVLAAVADLKARAAS